MVPTEMISFDSQIDCPFQQADDPKSSSLFDADNLTSAGLVLTILTSHFEATRGPFWDGPRNFEQRSDDARTTPELACPSPNFPTTPTGRRLTTYG
ncbi:hypothetical protein AVEN_27283-1 [Araneus ventricosus]|uniref:Uncharacterized protein n=1 Tax=Araneus ventricosus TaxID=182803 RepID=A0A4Y2JZK4_ARAVE|nr:hypothetical protein AVEN_27283-1 [Araneus ventricosus]